MLWKDYCNMNDVEQIRGRTSCRTGAWEEHERWRPSRQPDTNHTTYGLLWLADRNKSSVAKLQEIKLGEPTQDTCRTNEAADARLKPSVSHSLMHNMMIRIWHTNTVKCILYYRSMSIYNLTPKLTSKICSQNLAPNYLEGFGGRILLER